MRLTFRKHKPETGLSAVGSPHPLTDIKVNGEIVGMISPPNWRSKNNEWGVSLTVKRDPTPDERCPWKWIFLKRKFESEPKAREWLRDCLPAIIEERGIDLHGMESLE